MSLSIQATPQLPCILYYSFICLEFQIPLCIYVYMYIMLIKILRQTTIFMLITITNNQQLIITQQLNSFNIRMDNKVKLKAKVKGKCYILELDQNDKINSIIKFLKLKSIIPTGVKDQQIRFINNQNWNQIKQNTLIKDISLCQSSGLRQIQFVFGNADPICNLGKVIYDIKTSQAIQRVCQLLLQNKQMDVVKQAENGKISLSLLQLLKKLKKQDDNGNNQKIMKQLERKFSLAQKQKSHIYNIIRNYAETDQIVVNGQQNQISVESLSVFQYLKQKKDKLEMSRLLQMSSIYQTKKQFHLLFKSKIMEIPEFQSNIQFFSGRIKQFIERYSNEVISEIKSQFYLMKNNKDQFINKIFEKQNFILLFVYNQMIFGIFSKDAISNNLLRSSNGFFFRLSPNKSIKLEVRDKKSKTHSKDEKEPLWKKSAQDVKIGNDCLKIDKRLIAHLKEDRPFKQYFETQMTNNQLFGAQQNEFQLFALQFLTVHFQPNHKNQRGAQNKMFENISQIM